MTDCEQEQAGKAAARALLVDRLVGAGLRRQKGVTQAAHDVALDRLVGHFAYMTSPNLETLAEVVIDNATDGVWPSEALIRQFGEALQARPVSEARIISSWLASVEGPVAEAQGCLVELYRFLRRHRRPPLPMDKRKIAEEGADNARRRDLVADRIARGVAQPDDRSWLAAWERDQREARGLVDQGRRSRSGGDTGQAA